MSAALTAPARPLRAAIYCRISADREGRELGVERQEVDSRALCERLGHEVVKVFVENDLSASTRSRKLRPLYEELIEGGRSGQWDVIVAYSTSRLTRRPMENEELIRLHEQHGVTFAYVVSGSGDLSTAAGRQWSRIAASIDAGEAEQIAERVSRAKKQAAEQGRFRGSKRPFGFEKDGVTIRESEAKVISEATSAILAGRSLHALAKELNEAEVRTSTGRTWTHNRVRDVLVRPRNCGLISTGRPDHGAGHFQIVGPAVWPAIVDEDTWRACHQFLTDTRRRLPTHTTDVRWLLSGIARCGLCGSPLRGNPVGPGKGSGRVPKNHYRCSESPHLSVLAVPTEEHVRSVVATFVRDPKVVAAMIPTDTGEQVAQLRERRIALEARLSRAEDDYAAELINGAQLKKVTDVVSAELERIDVTVAERMRASALAPIVAAIDPGRAFLDAPIDLQRRVIEAAVGIEVLPTGYRGAAWSAGRIRLTPVG